MNPDESYALNRLTKHVKELEGKITRLINREANRSWRGARQNSYLKEKVKQLKAEKLALLNYIKELEHFNKLDLPELQK